jgi:uncharacterized membrane protein
MRYETARSLERRTMSLGIGNIAVVYGLTAVVFFLIDLFWLGFVAKGLYDRYLGSFLRDQVNWTAALLFYAVYLAGILVFVVLPALEDGSSVLRAALLGGFLGFFAYCTFDLTSLALIRNWPLPISVVDIAWGTILTGSTSAAVVWVARSVIKIG